MRPVTNPHDDLRLANQRGAELRKAAADHRLAAQLRSERRAEHLATQALTGSTTRRRLMVASAVVFVAVGIGALSTRVEAAAATDTGSPSLPCDHADGYRPMCSMTPGRPDGWFVPSAEAELTEVETTSTDLRTGAARVAPGPNGFRLR